MGYISDELHWKMRQERVLFSASMELLYTCNLRCSICYAYPDDKAKGLSLPEIKQLMEQLAEEGCLFLTITGGDPFVRHDILEILDYAVEKGFYITLKTNGTLMTEEHICRIKELENIGVNISLFAADCEKHDAQTQIKGSYEKALNALKLLSKYGVKTRIMTPLVSGNQNEVRKLYELSKELGHSFPPEFAPYITPRKNRDASPQQFRMSDEEFLQSQKEYENIKKEIGWVDEEEMAPAEILSVQDAPLCSAGTTYLDIDPYGNVSPCLAMEKFVGNVREKTIKEIQHSEDYKSLVKDMAKLNKHEIVFEGQKVSCMRCPANALNENGNFEKLPQEAIRQAVLYKKYEKEVEA